MVFSLCKDYVALPSLNLMYVLFLFLFLLLLFLNNLFIPGLYLFDLVLFFNQVSMRDYLNWKIILLLFLLLFSGVPVRR